MLRFAVPEPPEQGEKRAERQDKEERPAFAVDEVVDHLRPIVRTEPANHRNAEAVADDSERDNKRDENRASPAAPQEEVGGEQAGDEQDPAGPNSTALRSYFDGDSR